MNKHEQGPIDTSLPNDEQGEQWMYAKKKEQYAKY